MQDFVFRLNFYRLVPDCSPKPQLVRLSCALAALEKAGQAPGGFLARHVNRDLSEDDRKENEYSVMHGFRLLSGYRTNAGDKIWIITESDRSVTTLLLPEEY